MTSEIFFKEITRSQLEKLKMDFRERCAFCQKQNKKEGYFFEYADGIVSGISDKKDESIYCHFFEEEKVTIENEEKWNFKAHVPFYLAKIYRAEKMRAKQKKAGEKSSLEPLVPPKPGPIEGTVSPHLNFRGQLRDYQEQDCKKIKTCLDTIGACYFIADPGYGKTVVMCYVLSLYKVPSLLIVPTIGLADQSKKELKHRFPTAEIMVYDGKGDIPQNTDVVITFSQRIKGNANIFSRFEIVVLDEIHMLSSKLSLASVLCTKPKRILGLTATPGERNGITEKIVGPPPFKTDYVKNWFISFPRIISHLRGEKYTGKKGYVDVINDMGLSKNYVKKIITFVRYFNSIDERVILITMRTQHRDAFASVLKEEHNLTVGVLKSEDKKCTNCEVIIGTHKMIGTGFDLKNFIEVFDGKHAGVMIFVGSIKDETLVYQISGRAFRSEFACAIFPIVSEINTCKNHENEIRAKVSMLEGCTIKNDFGSFLENLEME